MVNQKRHFRWKISLAFFFALLSIVCLAPISFLQPHKREISKGMHRNLYLLTTNHLEDLVVGSDNHVPKWFVDWSEYHLDRLVKLDFLVVQEYELDQRAHDAIWDSDDIGLESPDSYRFVTWHDDQNWRLIVHCRHEDSRRWVEYVSHLASRQVR